MMRLSFTTSIPDTIPRCRATSRRLPAMTQPRCPMSSSGRTRYLWASRQPTSRRPFFRHASHNQMPLEVDWLSVRPSSDLGAQHHARHTQGNHQSWLGWGHPACGLHRRDGVGMVAGRLLATRFRRLPKPVAVAVPGIFFSDARVSCGPGRKYCFRTPQRVQRIAWA